MVDAEAVRADLANEEPGPLQRGGGVVDGGGVQLRFAQGEAQLRQVGHLIDLPAGGLEQDGGTDPPMNVPQGAGGVRIQGLGMRHRPGDVRFDGRVQPRFRQLP